MESINIVANTYTDCIKNKFHNENYLIMTKTCFHTKIVTTVFLGVKCETVGPYI